MPPTKFSKCPLSSAFGAGSKTARVTVVTLCGDLSQSEDEELRLQILRWRNHFARYYGSPLIPAEIFSELRDSYFADSGDSVEPEILLFAIHSYLSLCMKLIATRILTGESGNASPLHRIVYASTTQEILSEYAEIESGAYFNRQGFPNYTDDDFYGWVRLSRSSDTAACIQIISRRLLSNSDPSTMLPAANGPDIMQHLYQSIFPKKVRHKLGEYYTPRWLAEHVIEKLSYGGDARKTLLDPACGSGIFLLVALEKSLAAVTENSNKAAFKKSAIARLRNLSGFDINPLAVQAARTNILYLLCRFGLTTEPIELPIYLGDALSPLDISPVDIVVGNPPWIFWNAIPAVYRETLRPLFCERYRLMAGKASTMKRLGSAGKDISMLFFYTAMDKYVKSGGHLGFIVPQSLFQSTAADEFRQFVLPDGKCIGVSRVEDFGRLAIFDIATTNKTSVVYAVRGRSTRYPVSYTRYGSFSEGPGLEEKAGAIAPVERLFAWPHDAGRINSFWTLSETRRRIEGTRLESVRPRLGIETKLESVFRVTIQAHDRNLLTIENDRRRAKITVPPVTQEIEADLVYPFVSGASLRRWGYAIAGHYIVPHSIGSGQSAIDIGVMEDHYPLTLDYFNLFRRQLENRSIHLRWGKNQPFYALYGIGPYSFAPYRVAWKRTTREFSAAVISSITDPWLGKKSVVANGKVMIIPFDNKEEAHFICAVLNAPIFRRLINNAITSEAHAEIIRVIPLRAYDSANDHHRAIAGLSKELHRLTTNTAASGDGIRNKEAALDVIIKKEWGI